MNSSFRIDTIFSWNSSAATSHELPTGSKGISRCSRLTLSHGEVDSDV